MSETRIPTQKRSIETKQKIIDAGFELICNKGYYNTNTAEIAEYAKVSTGIVYQYFKDKKDILIEGIKNYSHKIMFPLINIDENLKIDKDNIDSLLNELIDKYIKQHQEIEKSHEELAALSHLDEDVATIFNETEFEVTEKLVKILRNNNINITNPYEKIHIAIGLVDNLCHEFTYHNHEKLDNSIMKEEVIKTIKIILK